MTQHPTSSARLSVTPALDADDVTFLTGFSRHAGKVSRIWPGQPAVPSPWVPCASGCCLTLVPPAGGEVAGQWLRFLITEFLGDRHRLDGRLDVPAPLERAATPTTVLIVEAGEVFQGEVGPVTAPQSRTPAARAGSA